jgi:hypothetical protein
MAKRKQDVFANDPRSVAGSLKTRRERVEAGDLAGARRAAQARLRKKKRK